MKREVKETDVYIKNEDGSVSVKRMMATVITIDTNDMGECERCGEEGRLLILSLEGIVCYQCAEEIDLAGEEE